MEIKLDNKAENNNINNNDNNNNEKKIFSSNWNILII